MKAVLLILLAWAGCDRERPAQPPSPTSRPSILVECPPGETAVILYLPDGSMQPGCQR